MKLPKEIIDIYGVGIDDACVRSISVRYGGNDCVGAVGWNIDYSGYNAFSIFAMSGHARRLIMEI